MFDPRASSMDPFRLQNGGRRALRVEHQDGDTVKHEVLFQDRYTALQDRRVFVGIGIPPRRRMIAFVVVIVLLSGLIARAAWMQVMHGAAYMAQANDNRFRHEVLPARRGIIRDRNGAILAENIPAFQVDMRWSDLPRNADVRNQEVAAVARIIGMTSEEILSPLMATGTHPDEWVTVARDVPYERAVTLEVHMPEFTGVALITGAKRRYPESESTPSLSHVLGYVGSISPAEYANNQAQGYRRNDEIGKTGVERSYESSIRGAAGERRTEVDALGHPRAVVGDRPPEDGQDVTLTIDLTLQKAAEAALRKGLERAKIGRGSVVVMDPRDGAVRALVALPAFDNNVFAGAVSSTVYQALLDDENHPLFPRAWAGQFPSGSTIKPLIATAALAEGVVTPRTTVFSTGGIHVGPWFFPDWREGGHGPTNVTMAIAWSINTFFYYVGGGYGDFIGLGVDRLTTWMRAFGLGTRTGLDLPGEADGHVPSQEWKQETKGERWYIGDTYNLSIGQGDLLVTPVQMARIAATVANGGMLVVPHVVMRAPSGAEGTSSIPDVARLDADAATLATVRQGMRETVTYGSGRALSALPFAAAGKTGTAQWRSDRPNHAWFIGYAPADHPEIVVTVLLEEGIGGDSYAVPVAGEIFRAWWEGKQREASD